MNDIVNTLTTPSMGSFQLKTEPLIKDAPSNNQSEKVNLIEPNFQLNEKSLISHEQLQAAVDRINQSNAASKRNVLFQVDSISGKDIVKVTSKQSGEIIRQLPSEELIKFAQNLEYVMGMIFDNKT
jgi:flagellar protein FlaG